MKRIDDEMAARKLYQMLIRVEEAGKEGLADFATALRKSSIGNDVLWTAGLLLEQLCRVYGNLPADGEDVTEEWMYE